MTLAYCEAKYRNTMTLAKIDAENPIIRADPTLIHEGKTRRRDFTPAVERAMRAWRNGEAKRLRKHRALVSAINLSEHGGGAVVIRGQDKKWVPAKKKPPGYLSDRGERWDTTVEAAAALGVTPQGVRTAMYQKIRVAGRIVWREGEPKPSNIRPPRTKAVVRDDGVVFASITDAAGRREWKVQTNSAADRLAAAIKAGRSYCGHVYRFAPTSKAVQQ